MKKPRKDADFNHAIDSLEIGCIITTIGIFELLQYKRWWKLSEVARYAGRCDRLKRIEVDRHGRGIYEVIG